MIIRVPWRKLSSLALIILAVCCCSISQADIEPIEQSKIISFDIPAEPLSSALVTFSKVAGVEIFVENALAANRRSTALSGTFDLVEGLRVLLADSGLVAQRLSVNTFVLVLDKTPHPATIVEPAIGFIPFANVTSSERDYYALVQGEVKQALCLLSKTQPGQYRIALQLWIDPAGIITSYKLLSSTGDALTDAAIQNTLRGFKLSEQLPAGLHLPINMVILPRPPQLTHDCQKNS